MKVVSILVAAVLASLLSLSLARPARTLDPFFHERVHIDCQSLACTYDALPYCTAKLGTVFGMCALKQAVCEDNDVQISCVELIEDEK